jgi:quercetin dioxygenase-like cupin family protein
MFLTHSSDVQAEPLDKPGFFGMKARFLLTANEGCPRYALRLMEFTPKGHCSFHAHKEEHEIYILEGEGVLKTDEGEFPIRAGDAVLLLPCEFHQIRNTGIHMLKMICTVPLFPGKTGKETTPC